MRVYVVTGASEYFHPKKVVAFEGLDGHAAGCHVPDFSWMRANGDGARVGPGPMYHDLLLHEANSAERLQLALSYVADTTPNDGAAVLLFPASSIVGSGAVPHAVTSLLDACCDRFGTKYTRHVCLSLSPETDLVLQRLYQRLGQAADEPGLSGLLHVTAGVQSLPLREAMRRNFTFNALRLGLGRAFRDCDTLFEPGRRPELLAEAADQQEVRLRPELDLDAFIGFCERIARSQFLAPAPLTMDLSPDEARGAS